jgi:hypothetical protein
MMRMFSFVLVPSIWERGCSAKTVGLPLSLACLALGRTTRQIHASVFKSDRVERTIDMGSTGLRLLRHLLLRIKETPPSLHLFCLNRSGWGRL